MRRRFDLKLKLKPGSKRSLKGEERATRRRLICY